MTTHWMNPASLEKDQRAYSNIVNKNNIDKGNSLIKKKKKYMKEREIANQRDLVKRAGNDRQFLCYN